MTVLDRLLARPGTDRDEAAEGKAGARTAIIDIGSNSVRLVVYDGPRRIPSVLFNEKVMAGLGGDVGSTGTIDAEAFERGLAALRRFAQLCRDMNVDQIRCVATAAVREAANGGDFVLAARECGLDVEILSGEAEGLASAYGLLSGMPGADGIMGDLGGGSLELVRVRGGRIERSVSIPLGVLRVQEIRARGKQALGRALTKMLKAAGWTDLPQGLPFYLVGGSWRALARLDMHATDYPLPIFHSYEMTPDRASALVRLLQTIDRGTLKTLPSLSAGRVPTMPDAAALLEELVGRLAPERLVISAYGLREGLLYQTLPLHVAAEDPLLVAAMVEGDAQARFAGHGLLIDDWIAPLFADDSAQRTRIRRAACLLGDVGWRANPDFRAERGLETGLHGNWVGITGAERAMLGQALHSAFGGGQTPLPQLQRLADGETLARAIQWGLAIRLAQRLSGGAAAGLERMTIAMDADTITLGACTPGERLLGEVPERRLKQLATALGRDYRIAGVSP